MHKAKQLEIILNLGEGFPSDGARFSPAAIVTSSGKTQFVISANAVNCKVIQCCNIHCV